jgi:tRNA(Ile)-lysidine synthase
MLARVRPDVLAVHVDHGLRPDDYPAEAAVRRSVVAALGVPFVEVRAEVSRTDHSAGPEDAARRARYAAFDMALAPFAPVCLAVAHTLDDVAETVLLRIGRGTGIDGLAVMPEHAGSPFGHGSYTVWRPLRTVPRSLTRAWCETHAIPFCDDPSNQEPRFVRNRLRHEAFPLLEAIAPGFAAHAAALADDAAAVDALLDRLAESALRDIGDGADLARKGLRNLDPALQPLVVQAWWQRRTGLARLERVHLRDVVAAANKGGTRISLPGGWTAAVDAGRVSLVPPT